MKQQSKLQQTEIGEIPENWDIEELKVLLSNKGYIRGPFGSALLRNELKTSGIPVYEQEHAIYNTRKFRYFIDEDKFKELSRFAVKENDLIISCSGTLGKVSIISKDEPRGIISQALLILRPNINKINPHFLKFFFISKKGYSALISRSSGSVQVNLAKREIIEEVKIAVPSLPEQEAIVNFLSSLDSKIELNQQISKNLEAVSQAIFKQWLMDFEFPNEKGKPYKGSGGEIAYNEELEKDVPVNCDVKPLDIVADFLNGLPLQKYPAETEESSLPVIKIRELRQGIINSTDRCSTNLPDEYIIRDGDIIFSWSGSLDIEIWCNGKGGLNQHLFKVTSKDYPKWFYYFWVKHHLPKFQHIAEGKATTMGHIQRHHLTESLVISPPKEVLKQMDKVMAPLFDRIINARVESKILAQIRDLLLPKLMSGKIRVDDEVN